MLDRIMISELRSIPIKFRIPFTNFKGKGWHTELRKHLSKVIVVETDLSREPLVACDRVGLLGSDYYHAIAQKKHLGTVEIQQKAQAFTNQTIWLRESVANDLKNIDVAIAETGYRLYLRSGYRSPELQRLIRHFATLERDMDFTDKMLSDPDFYSPHATGGAFDIELMDISTEKLIPTKFPEHFDRQYLESLTTTSDFEQEIRDNRRLIHNLLTTDVILPPDRVFIPQPFEYWHYGRNEKLSSALAAIQGESHPSYYQEVKSNQVFQ
jgi:D-alanyl-D-alanine dipeptidase